MKIAVLIDTWFPFIGGGQINALEISKELAKKGNKVEIITRNCGFYNIKKIKNLNINKLCKASKTNNDIARLKYLCQALFYIYQNDFDIVIAHAFLPGLVAKTFMILKKGPAVFVVHGTSIGTGLNFGAKNLLEKLILTKIKYSAQITVSRDFLKLKNENKNIYYIPNGVNVRNFDAIITKKENYPTLLFVGRLHPQKNLKVLIQALPQLITKWPKLKLNIVGNGPLKEELVDLSKKLKIKNNMDFKGGLQGRELIKAYKSSHLFVLPSVYEGQPLVVLEAWAAKLPVVASKTGDCQYMIKNGQNGYLIKDQHSIKSVADIINIALSNKNLSKLGQRGYEYIKRDLTWESAANKTLNVCKSLI